jgi:membrane protein
MGENHFAAALWKNVRHVLGFFLLAVVFLIINKMVTGSKYSFGRLMPGAILCSGAWIILSLGFSLYVNNFNNYSVIYGSLAGIMLLMLWLYWSALILLFGAVLNVVLSDTYSPESELIPPLNNS